MITTSGVHIQKIGGAAGTPCAWDIAVHAGRICRFGGTVWYPLLPHLVLVGLLAWKRSRRLNNFAWGVLHDAHEIATADVPAPFKCDCMRTEQAAIDTRLLTKFFGIRGHLPNTIDFDLIKECDRDACDIEGVYLEIPGFAELQLAGDRTELHADRGDVKLFWDIKRVFGGVDTITGGASSAVTSFAGLLKSIENRKVDEVGEWIRSWPLYESEEK